MTISKGQPWGTEGVVPHGVEVADSDRALALSTEPCQLTAGNIHAALGRPTPKKPGEPCMILPVDALEVVIHRRGGPGASILAAGEVIIGRWQWGRHCVIATNAGVVGDLNIAPRAHPNDGVMDVLTRHAEMRFRERWLARRKARLGTHLPHPNLEYRTSTDLHHDRHGREPLWVDGVRVTSWTSVSIRVRTDRWSVIV